ncbi:hypothetical protein SAMN02910291_01887 [Desulfovibrio desulfuricans]|uniref:Uncharacterized protein n=2 Tax=Desulfovibrio TaxID=872 RepID=A0AA94HTJ5_DESDE|nr:hypothetical protein SAMN02910291_01887 [Desulfovibrio desulfuricans]SPD36790.1 Major facilitator superfamily transporter [Desulfovibrio sp. G11]
MLLWLFCFYGLFMEATEGVEKAFGADFVPEGRRGCIFGWFNMLAGMLFLPASVTFGFLYQGYPLRLLLFFREYALLWRLPFLAAALLKGLVVPVRT